MTPFEGTDLTEDFELRAPIPLARRVAGRIEATGPRYERTGPIAGTPSLERPEAEPSATGREQVERFASNRKVI